MPENFAPQIETAAIGDEVNVRCPCGSGKWMRDCHPNGA